MIVIVTPIDPAAQNAEMARFKKSQIFDRTWWKMIEKITFV